MKLLTQSLIISFSFITVFVWQNSPLSDYTVAFLGFLIALYLVISSRQKGRGFLTLGGDGPWGIFILNTLIFLLIFSTGSLNSPLYFLLYFLGFGVAFIFEPVVTFIFVLGAILIFVPDALEGDVSGNFLKLASLLLISPLAYFFGSQYKKSSKDDETIVGLKERTNEAANTISSDLEEVIKREKQNLREEDMEKLNEVLEETEDLREESKQ